MSPGPVGSPLGVWGVGRCAMYRSVRTFYLHYFHGFRHRVFRRVERHASQTDGTRLAGRWNTLRLEVFGARIAYFGANLESVGNIRFSRGAVFQSVAFFVTPFFPVFCLRNRHFSPFSAHVFCAPSVPLGTKSLQCFLLGEYLHAYLIMFARGSRLVPRLSPFPSALAGSDRAFFG